jgi:hypothetical protein
MLFALAVVAVVSTAPQASDIEGILARNEFCVVTIDACIDGETGQQIIPNTEYKVSNVICRRAGLPAGDKTIKRSMRCGYSVRETRWMNNQPVGDARISKQSATFDLRKLTDVGENKETLIFWRQRPTPRN